ncbi:CAP domain-containing protein [Bacteroidia bacterium]|nr:CAP domain-containing protein [Bacteroidia bacterium]MDB9882731.1 CAP domain-containing protein [Bacteroidia bacterium]
MSRVTIILSVLLIGFNSLAVEPNDKIDAKNFNHLFFVKTLHSKINAYRKENGLRPLMNNSIIAKVSNDQCNYLKNKKELTHDQPTIGKKNVQERLLHYINVKRYSVAENLAKTYVLRNTQNYMRDGSTKRTVASTYDEAAKYMLNAWIQSDFHNKNILNPKYELSGLSAYFNPVDFSLTAVQVFAKID